MFQLQRCFQLVRSCHQSLILHDISYQHLRATTPIFGETKISINLNKIVNVLKEDAPKEKKEVQPMRTRDEQRFIQPQDAFSFSLPARVGTSTPNFRFFLNLSFDKNTAIFLRKDSDSVPCNCNESPNHSAFYEVPTLVDTIFFVIAHLTWNRAFFLENLNHMPRYCKQNTPWLAEIRAHQAVYPPKSPSELLVGKNKPVFSSERLPLLSKYA